MQHQTLHDVHLAEHPVAVLPERHEQRPEPGFRAVVADEGRRAHQRGHDEEARREENHLVSEVRGVNGVGEEVRAQQVVEQYHRRLHDEPVDEHDVVFVGDGQLWERACSGVEQCAWPEERRRRREVVNHAQQHTGDAGGEHHDAPQDWLGHDVVHRQRRARAEQEQRRHGEQPVRHVVELARGRHGAQRLEPVGVPFGPASRLAPAGNADGGRLGVLVPTSPAIEAEVDPGRPLRETVPHHALLERLRVEQPRRQRQARDREPDVPRGHQEDVPRAEPRDERQHHRVRRHVHGRRDVAGRIRGVQRHEAGAHVHAACGRLIDCLAGQHGVVDGVPARLGDEHVEDVRTGEGVLVEALEHLHEAAVQPPLQHGRPRHDERSLDHPLAGVEQFQADFFVEPHGVERVAIPEERLHVQHRDHQLAHDKRGKRREEQKLGEEDTRAGLEKRERAEKVQPFCQAVEVTRDELHAVPAGDLEVELVRAVEGNFASLANHHEPHVLHATATQHQVHAAEDVLAQVQLPRCLGDAALPAHPAEVPHVGVPVVKPHVQGLCQEALDDRAEHLLRERGERRH